jgi:hypothetical protein
LGNLKTILTPLKNINLLPTNYRRVMRKQNVYAAWLRYNSRARVVATTSKPSQHRIEYCGTLCGHRAYGTVKRTTIGDKSSPVLNALGSSENETKFSLIIDQDNQKISGSENPTATSPSFYELTIIVHSQP